MKLKKISLSNAFLLNEAFGRIRKKAFEQQYQWIFVLIAGIVILAFFVNIAQKQYSTSQQKISVELLRNFETSFIAALKSPDTASPIISNIDIGFSCTKECDCSFNINEATWSFGDKMIFSPKKLVDGNITMWSLPFETPFQVSNFLFLSNNNVKYYIVYDKSDDYQKSLAKFILKNLPSRFYSEDGSVKIFEEIDNPKTAELKNYAGHSHTRFVFIGSKPNFMLRESFKDSSVSAIVLNDDNVKFYFKENNGITLISGTDNHVLFPKNDKSSIFASIFSSNQNMLKCGLESAYSRFKTIAKIHLNRISNIEQTYRNCNYNYAKQQLNSVLSSQDIANVLDAFSSSFKNSNIALIKNACPEVY